ncbi:MAG: hypothetical protein IJY09_00490 [Lachnospiraceae bacterium]|nr:hypothetical protein [Lachnospiraceae bacterium]
MITMKDSDNTEKKTVLDDSAAIYQRREQKTERQKFSEMKTFSEKVAYFRMYHLKPMLAGIIIIAIIVSILYTVFSPKAKCVLSVAFVNYAFPTVATDPMKEDFMESSGLVLGEREMVRFDATTYINTTTDYSSASALAAHVMACELDIFIAPESTFKNYSFNGTLGSLTEILPSDLSSALSEDFFYHQIRIEDEDISEATGEKYVLGIYLEDTAFWDTYSGYVSADPSNLSDDERPIVGIVVNSKNKENAITFLRYLFDLKNE